MKVSIEAGDPSLFSPILSGNERYCPLLSATAAENWPCLLTTQAGCLGRGRRPMTLNDRFYADPTASRNGPRARALVARAVQTLSPTTADALYSYAVTGSAFATLMALAAPHFDVFFRCLFHGKRYAGSLRSVHLR